MQYSTRYEPLNTFHAVVIAVAHNKFKLITEIIYRINIKEKKIQEVGTTK